MPSRFTQLLVLLAAAFLPLCCCKIGGWDALLRMNRPATKAVSCCPLCGPTSAPTPAPEAPKDRCSSCSGFTGVIPDAPALIGAAEVCPLPAAALAAILWTIPEPVFVANHVATEAAVHRGGRDLLRLHCALII